jgi:hypothetical protein
LGEKENLGYPFDAGQMLVSSSGLFIIGIGFLYKAGAGVYLVNFIHISGLVVNIFF